MLDSTPGLTVTEVAGSAGLSCRTLRYHERIGLLEQSPVAATATVAYGESDHQTRGVGAVSSRGPNAGGYGKPGIQRPRDRNHTETTCKYAICNEGHSVRVRRRA